MLSNPHGREREGKTLTKAPRPHKQTAAAATPAVPAEPSPALLLPHVPPQPPWDGEQGNKSTYSPPKSRRAKITFPLRSGPFLFKPENSRRDTRNALNLKEPARRAPP